MQEKLTARDPWALKTPPLRNPRRRKPISRNPTRRSQHNASAHMRSAPPHAMPRPSHATAVRLLWAITIAYWLAIFTLTHIPAPKLPTIHVSDKIEHLVSYGGL